MPHFRLSRLVLIPTARQLELMTSGEAAIAADYLSFRMVRIVGNGAHHMLHFGQPAYLISGSPSTARS